MRLLLATAMAWLFLSSAALAETGLDRFEREIKPQIDLKNFTYKGAETLGMRIVDIRLKQIDLPTDSDVITQVYDRMRAERKQVASALRAEGEEQARTVRAQADRDQAVLVAEAERDAQRLRGEGDAQAARLFANAANQDPAFFAFHRSLEAYRGAFADGQGVIVIDKDDPFLQYFKNDR